MVDIKGKEPGKRKQYNFNAEDDVVAFLETVDNKTETIHKALRLLMNQPTQASLEARVAKLEQLLDVPEST